MKKNGEYSPFFFMIEIFCQNVSIASIFCYLSINGERLKIVETDSPRQRDISLSARRDISNCSLIWGGRERASAGLVTMDRDVVFFILFKNSLPFAFAPSRDVYVGALLMFSSVIIRTEERMARLILAEVYAFVVHMEMSSSTLVISSAFLFMSPATPPFIPKKLVR